MRGAANAHHEAALLVGDGLVVLAAWYGDIACVPNAAGSQGRAESEVDNEERARVVDVTVVLRFLMRDGRVEVCSGRKQAMLGFYDPTGDADLNQLLVRCRITCS